MRIICGKAGRDVVSSILAYGNALNLSPMTNGEMEGPLRIHEAAPRLHQHLSELLRSGYPTILRIHRCTLYLMPYMIYTLKGIFRQRNIYLNAGLILFLGRIWRALRSMRSCFGSPGFQLEVGLPI